jgi:hypothetical protein
MTRRISKKEKLLHELQLKICGFTCYSDTKLTTGKFIKSLFRKSISPFKRKGWFGICDRCGLFRGRLQKEVIDCEPEQNESGWTSYPIYGMVCRDCVGIVRERMENGD